MLNLLLAAESTGIGRGTIWFLVFIGIVVFALLVVGSMLRFVPQSEKYVIERFGAYKTTWDKGGHLLMPFIDRVAYRITMKEQVVDFEPQPVITKDNVTMQIDTVVFYQITDPKLYAYGVDRPLKAIENLTATTLRNLIGELELDETLTSRDIINTKMRSILDEATDPWGIKINRVEVKNIMPPKDIRDAMEKQMRAERERRESILRAEGEKKAAILSAEGEKISSILRAEAAKEAQIRRAEAEAESILKVQQATAEGIRLINEANAGEAYLQLKGLEALAKVADGQATKLIIPSNLQGLAGLAASITEVIKTTKEK